MNKKTAVVIGSGFAGLSAASTLAKAGFEVTLLEKNDSIGGRARKFKAKGFTFDMGPSWYWMPDVFESYFKALDKKVTDYYELVRLDPSYRVIFNENESLDIPANYVNYAELIDKIEKGGAAKLGAFLKQAAYKYEVGMKKLVYKPSRSAREFLSLQLLLDILRLDVFTSFHRHIRKYFTNEKILQLMEFPILFLGAVAKDTPALYSLMNYADIKLGTWYPMGGMYKIVEGMGLLAEELGVKIKTGEEVIGFDFEGENISKVLTKNHVYECDAVVAGADYQHVESVLLPEKFRTYSTKYWERRVMAPSSLIFYLGINKKIKKLKHHNLFFDRPFGPHAKSIYKQPGWPEEPLFYVCVPSKTDSTVAPPNCENMFILIPLATELRDSDDLRERYFHKVIDRIEAFCGEQFRENIVYKKSYAHSDFIRDYHAFKGNAYGLANSLSQTAILKPKMKSKKVRNLYFTGQLTVPGPGVPPSIISGRVVANEIIKDFK